MPDKRRHRGPHPDDGRLFDPSQHTRLRRAVAEFSWLLSRGYARDSGLKLVGDRHCLTARQRMAVQRSSCSDESLEVRSAKRLAPTCVSNQRLGVDGYNLLITVECALSSALILIGRDGCCRDIAGIHGTYRKVDETRPAVELIVDYLADLTPQRVDFYIDRPVSNSGRLKALIADVLEARANAGPKEAKDRFMLGDQGGSPALGSTLWNIELVSSPDAILVDYPGLVASGDSVILDGCNEWVNLAGDLLETRLSKVWKVDLRSTDTAV